MNDANKENLWPRFERLFVEHYCPDLWSWDDIELPYGRVMVVDPDDMPTMLWRGDLNSVDSFDSILDDLGKIEKQHNVPAGFAITSSWSGDVEAFKEYIDKNGFEIRVKFHWLSKNIATPPPEDLQSGFIIEESKDLEAFTKVMEIGFSKEIADIFYKGAVKHIDDPSRVYFVAKDPKTSEVIGCGACCYLDNLAYMSCLAVDEAYRKRGVAKDLVRARVNFLKSKGVDYIVTAVNEKNDASMAVQNKSGYQSFEIAEYWMKPEDNV